MAIKIAEDTPEQKALAEEIGKVMDQIRELQFRLARLQSRYVESALGRGPCPMCGSTDPYHLSTTCEHDRGDEPMTTRRQDPPFIVAARWWREHLDMSEAAIGKEMGVSKQRVEQLLRQAERCGEIIPSPEERRTLREQKEAAKP